MRRYPVAVMCVLVLGFAVSLIPSLARTSQSYRTGSLRKQEPQRIFSSDPQDPWNRIFYLLFTRTVMLRLADNFKDAAPFVPLGPTTLGAQRAGARIFERIESGDRAIDPLYPSFLISAGAESVLRAPRFAELRNTLRDALGEQVSRPPIERALMQSDAWAAFDILDRDYGFRGRLLDRRNELLTLLAQFVRKLALTPEEITKLPNNYAAAQGSEDLPPVSDERSGWIEIEWFPERVHDSSADFRRASRVFVLPKLGAQQFLHEINDLLQENSNSFDLTSMVDGLAIITEDLLIDSNCRVEPSPLIFDVETRNFLRDGQGHMTGTKIGEYELSRKLLLANTASGGLHHVGPEEPVYLPSADNDYTFASPSESGPAPHLPILANLRRRCEACHFKDASAILTFRISRGPGDRLPQLRELRSSDDPHGHYVAQQKMNREDFQELCGPISR